MILLEMINSLNEEESAFLLAALNTFFPSIVEIDLRRVMSYQFPMLARNLISIREKVKDEALPIYHSLCAKLCILLDVDLPLPK